MKKLTTEQIHTMLDEYHIYLSNHFQNLSIEMIRFMARPIVDAISSASPQKREILANRWFVINNYFWCVDLLRALRPIQPPQLG